ncbi:hypothetical protein LTR56_008891 [Elasticomyces elasticus]|nr:hypothetical protein LTR56_008891 [Elasticomyces elasticus]KAK3663122.1 hypothetical protein LTR22_006031 [Elasticomyces elasticus]KAK4924018.1 hypothetical protein LTR49_008758 [Elasticomyces elasticus]KAK5764375.1 hypothetical protein LTS12_005351 [Elasticomyces elasticus]
MAPPTTPDKWPSADIFDKTINVEVGTKRKKPFTLHRGVLSFYSGYFEAAMKETFKEGSEGVIELPNENVSTFEPFVRWLYTRKLPETPATGDDIRNLINLWLFADRRECPLLANQVLDAVRDAIVRRWQVPAIELRNIYENTSESSGLRRLFLYIISRIGHSNLLIDVHREKWPAEALWDLLKCVWQLKEDKAQNMSKNDIAKLDMCQFHTHEKGVECPKK